MKRFIFALIFVNLLFLSCDNPVEQQYVTESISEDYSSIVDPKERWEAYNLSDYYIEQTIACECYPPNAWSAFIVDRMVKDVKYQISKDQYYGRTEQEIYENIKHSSETIDGVFNLIDFYKNSAHKMIVEYDHRFGYPTHLFIDIDSLMADEEIIRGFSSLQRIVSY